MFVEDSVVLVWDLPLRLFHCLLVLAVAAAWLTAELGGLWLDWHAHLGIFVLTLLVFRLAWGFMGGTYARFCHFFPTPRRLAAFYSSRWQGPGHSPQAALSVFALLGASLTQACLGLFAMNDESEFHGPLYELVSSSLSERLTAWHRQVFDVLAMLIAVHVLAIVYYLLFKHRNLILPMITGKSAVTQDVPPPTMQGGNRLHVLLAVSLAGGVFCCLECGALLRWLAP